MGQLHLPPSLGLQYAYIEKWRSVSCNRNNVPWTEANPPILYIWSVGIVWMSLGENDVKSLLSRSFQVPSMFEQLISLHYQGMWQLHHLDCLMGNIYLLTRFLHFSSRPKMRWEGLFSVGDVNIIGREGVGNKSKDLNRSIKRYLIFGVFF